MKALGYLGLGLAALVILPWDFGIIPGPMLHNGTSTAADQPQETATYSRRVLTFPCSGLKCQAWLYLPKHTQGKPPIVVAAHGIGCQKDLALAQYGEKFAQAGLASFIFDYRTFGGSEGLPRHWASPGRHLEDYVSAVQYVREHLGAEVDVGRVNLWGSSFSGGHVLALAGGRLRDEVTAVVAQVPMTDGPAFLLDNFKRRPLVVVRAILAGIHDALRSLFTYPPAYIPLTGERGSFSMLDISPEEADAFYGTHPQERQGGWRNIVRAKVALDGLYKPLDHVHNIKAPVLYLAATGDTIIPLDTVMTALKQTPDAQLYTVEGNHFSVYSGAPFQQLVGHMVEFLQDRNGVQHVATPPAAAGGESESEDEDEEQQTASESAAEL